VTGAPVAAPTGARQVLGTMTFKDHFSTNARAYAEFRPTYPDALFDFVASLAPSRRVAWDCATVNGQAALPLAERFEQVIATDASAAQIEHAATDPRIEYRVAPAESSGLPAASIDLVTVAQSLHWFDFERFYDEVRRVLVPEGVLAVWTYGDPELEDPARNDALRRFSRQTLGTYWPPERQLVWESYRTIPFPFRRIPTPPFVIERSWSLDDLMGYVRTWSASERYRKLHGEDSVSALAEAMGRLGGAADNRHLVRWPITLLAGRA